MSKYRKKVLIAMQLCPIVLLTLLIAASVGAQTSPAPPQNAVAAPPLFAVTHDSTLQGDGTSANPLGITASPVVSGSTDENGDAVVQMPEYFEALNRDFRYQLTAIGTFAQSIVAEKIKDNHFRIKTSLPKVEVSWQVTGVRQDAYANKNRIPVEQYKAESERGYYLHPDAFNQPSEKGILMAQHPEMMRPEKPAPDKAQKGRFK